MRHVYNFGSGPYVTPYERSQFETVLLQIPPRRLAEIVLIGSQCYEDRMKMIKDAGFVFVHSFINGNTRRRCYIFHRHPDLSTRAPRGWNDV